MPKAKTRQSLLRTPDWAAAAVALALAAFPLLTDSNSTLIMMTHIFIMGAFAMSYDILLGYTGIVSFGHAMFFGIGAYAVAIMMDRFGASGGILLLALLIAVILAAAVSYVVGMLSLRLKSHFYAMLTLAFAGLFLVGAQKWRSLTGGNDGFTFPIPDALKDRQTFYFLSLAFLIVVFLLLRRFTQSPVGRVLQAIRENEARAGSLGYAVLHYKVIASVVAGVVAALCGGLHVMTLRFVNAAVFSTEVTLDALLMTIIGGVGTLYGSLIGAGIIELAHEGLTDLAKVHWIFERWLILFGLVYIVVVMLFPLGLVGTVKKWRAQLQKKHSR
ncbi:branched-chain amino acid ABC transporter permease [Paenibacillus sp.]|uniref:branched-chain amino acid ABC transporter permease n=1 Tax=Paenibacillus sp. TaxID=58172 RepID=UPI002D4FD1A4|nr:branched-chain amino acid ABC transporter permease [Paenibacillus sp.]HZG87800.1 branched-chain amino acid ABC transporter permease [Paenibacillus sp.]